MISISFSLWVSLPFPGWVLAISVYILFGNVRRQAPAPSPS